MLPQKDTQNAVLFPQEHEHNHFEFCMVLEGQVHIFHYGKPLLASQSMTLLFPPGSSHCETPCRAGQNYKLLWGALNPIYVRLFISKYTGGKSCVVTEGVDLPHSTPLIQGLNSELYSVCQLENQALRGHLFQAILILIFAQGIHVLQNQSGDEKKWSNRIAVEAEKYIEANITKPLTLKEIADSIHLSPCYLSGLYARLREHTLFDYLNCRRIYRACELLTNPKLNISEIASQVGFDDALYFSKVFKKIKGRTPTVYRKSLF